MLLYVVTSSFTVAACPNAPCYHGGTCAGGVCQCPTFCKGEHCEDCDRDPYPPQKQVTIGAVDIDVALLDGYIVSNNNKHISYMSCIIYLSLHLDQAVTGGSKIWVCYVNTIHIKEW